jgi:cell fate regulator YaaT (PSP1 superfamily)
VPRPREATQRTSPIRDPSPRKAPPNQAPLAQPDTDIDLGWEVPAAGGDARSQPSLSLSQYGYDDDNTAVIPPLRLLEGPPAPPPDPDGDDVFAELMAAPPPPGVVANVVGIKFRPAGKIFEYDAGELALARGERVVVDGDGGATIATVAVESARRMVPTRELRRIVRRADSSDERQITRGRDKEVDALLYGRERVRERRLPMKLFKAEYQHSGHRAIFYFTSESRIDFRDLVKDLAHRLHMRIEMRQVGVRDEAKMVGGIGDCGRELCCSTWLPQFAPVSIRMAKDQGIVLNPTRVSGQCGRLKCCLVYEEALYRELRKGMPKLGKRVTTPEGEGRVQEINVLRGRIRVALAVGGSKQFLAGEVTPMTPPPTGPGGRPAPPEPEVETDESDGGETPSGVPTE